MHLRRTISALVLCVAGFGTTAGYMYFPTYINQLASALHVPYRIAGNAPQRGTPVRGYDIVQSWPHDSNAYSQGLVFHEGVLYESTGLYGRSTIRTVELTTGKVLQQEDVPIQYFAEGMTMLGDKLYQLTWDDGIGLIYDRATLEPQGEFLYSGEGWGLTTDQQSLILSDGSNVIRFLDPTTFAVVRTIRVSDQGAAVALLNELEYVRGEIYANVYRTDLVVRIDPGSGHVLGWIDFSGLLSPEERQRPVNVLNGIAYDADEDRLFVTGKLWPKLFEVRPH
jgi:glutaminyl-peptide cyclotransferase